MNIAVKGLDVLQSTLRKLAEHTSPEAYGQALEKAAKTVVQAQAKFLCPVDTGYIRNSISEETKRTDAGGWEATVYTDTEYAAYVEFGTGQRGHEAVPGKSPMEVSYREDWTGMKAQPYLYPALANNREKILTVMTSEIRRRMT